MLLGGDNADEFFQLACHTLESYVNAVHTSPSRVVGANNEYRFVISLMGVITNITASSFGRELISSKDSGKEVLKAINSVISEFPFQEMKWMKMRNVALKCMYNISINMFIPYISYRPIKCGCIKSFISSIVQNNTSKYITTNRATRPHHLFIRQLSVEPEKEKICSAYSTCETYDLSEIRKHFINKVYASDSNTEYSLAHLPKDASDVLHVKVLTNNNELGHVFIFKRLGSFVCWNVSKSEVWFLKKLLSQYEKSPFSLVDTHEVNEELNFFTTNGASSLTDGDIYLCNKLNEESQALEKMAFSNAVALSVKLDAWEIALDRFSGSLRYIPEQLKNNKKIDISRDEIMKKIGELLSLRHQINLYSDTLATPDFYWNHEELERLYSKTCAYLEISKRTKVMNSKMDLCSELVQMLRCHLNDEHSHRLEWMIIILIVFEVIFEILHLVTRWSEK